MTDSRLIQIAVGVQDTLRPAVRRMVVGQRHELDGVVLQVLGRPGRGVEGVIDAGDSQLLSADGYLHVCNRQVIRGQQRIDVSETVLPASAAKGVQQRFLQQNVAGGSHGYTLCFPCLVPGGVRTLTGSSRARAGIGKEHRAYGHDSQEKKEQHGSGKKKDPVHAESRSFVFHVLIVPEGVDREGRRIHRNRLH